MTPATPVVTPMGMVCRDLRWIPLFTLGRISTGWPTTEGHRPVSRGQLCPVTEVASHGACLHLRRPVRAALMKG
jgi:hypothetical protein